MSQPTPAAFFAARLANETDCADVHLWMRRDPDSVVVLDVRSREAFDDGHVPGAVSLPHQQITAEALAALGRDVTFVTYCWGPHCNGATKGAAAIAALGRPVKEMLGGVWGWGQEGYDLAVSEVSRR
ncbi:rhodanese-like domain-containing protein [Euzebya tangerina]|uniref:rhodanese-like domain-containing protein n=1 Tax=Euzebya tangerina TaxID=591198 RepID=UPI00196AD1A8|nr:rhodanese-like domain-containing protein [Euzebya tangerina]